MKKLTAIITIVLILLFLGFLIIQNCGCCKSKCSAEEVETEEGAVCTDDCQKACCLGCHATEGDAACLADHSCCFHHEHEGETDSLFEAIEDFCARYGLSDEECDALKYEADSTDFAKLDWSVGWDEQAEDIEEE